MNGAVVDERRKVHAMKLHTDWDARPRDVATRPCRRTRRWIPAALVLLCAVMALSPGIAQASRLTGVGQTPAPTPASTPTWSDEFNGPAGASPDSSKWYMLTLGSGCGHHELEFYTARACNAATDGRGHLAITALSETYSGGGYTQRYTSGETKSRGLFETTYGSIQARIKIPEGRGLWPAFFMQGADSEDAGWPQCGEIDVMEILGHDPFTVHASIHGPTAPAIPQGYDLPLTTRSATSLADEFHTYGVNWSPGSIQMTLDGVTYASYTPNSLSWDEEWVFDKPFYLILDLAVGGDWPGPPDTATLFPATMLIDWVRVYSTPTSPSPPTPTPTPTLTPAPTPTPTPTLIPAPTPTRTDTVGPAFAAKNVTVKNGRTCRVCFKAYDSQSSQVATRVVITTKSGVVKRRWSLGYIRNLNVWLWTRYTCRLRKGTYHVTVTGRDLAGNPASVVGRARLVVK